MRKCYGRDVMVRLRASGTFLLLVAAACGGETSTSGGGGAAGAGGRAASGDAGGSGGLATSAAGGSGGGAELGYGGAEGCYYVLLPEPAPPNLDCFGNRPRLVSCDFDSRKQLLPTGCELIFTPDDFCCP